MAASNPQGEMQFWFNGAPFPGVKLGSQDTGEMQFWFNGAPIPAIYPAAAGVTATTPRLMMMGVGVLTAIGVGLGFILMRGGLL